MPRKGSKDYNLPNPIVSKSPIKPLDTEKFDKSSDADREASDSSRNRFRRLTTGSLYQPRGSTDRKGSDVDARSGYRFPMDPISNLLGLDGASANFEVDPADAHLHSPSILSSARGRHVKRYVRSAPSGFGTDNYSTALGPLQEKHKLNPLERVFLEAAECGDKSTLARCLSFKEKVNVNCVNMLGRTAIQIAVDNENIELVELLLKQPGIKIGDALLYAIQEGVYRIVEMLIDHPSITKEMLGTTWTDRADFVSHTEEESHDFSADISPVILAAVCNQFEILQLLLNRGARIEEPHQSSCSCVKCHRLLNEDPLKHTLQRINTYRALASPAWISLTSPDPILTAFELSSELLHLASRENEFKEIFISLCEQCRKYACDLLDLCRGTGEVVAVLSKSNFSDSEASDEDEEVDQFAMDKANLTHDPTACNHNSCNSHPEVSVLANEMAAGELPVVNNKPEYQDWRALANRSNGTKRRHVKSESFYHRSVSSVQLRQGLSLESQHTVSDELADDMAASSMLTLPKVGALVRSPEDHHHQHHLHVPGSQTGHKLAIHDGSVDPKRIIGHMDADVPSTSVTLNPADSTSDDGTGLSYAVGPGTRSTLFSEPRRVSFDHESQDPIPPSSTFTAANDKRWTVGKVKCCGCCCYCGSCGDGPRKRAVKLRRTPAKETNEFCSFKLDRLKLAIKHEQKRFVAHPHCQHLLTTLWYDQLPGWRKRNPFAKFFLCFCFIIIMPILAPVYLLYPHGKIGQLLRSPLIKFINHSASFAIFIILLLIASMDSSTQENLRRRSEIRGPDPNKIEIFILWWVIGFVWSEMKQIWEEGFKAYVRQWWNWLDFIMLALYLTTVALRVVAMILRKTAQYGTEPTPRTEWPATDPTLLSEALFSIAHIFSFARIIFLFQVNEHLGPLQISLGNMLIDITKFIFIFLLVISSFACGLHQLYYYYVSKQEDYRPSAFSSLISSYQTLFWNLFGNSQMGHFEVRSVNAETGVRETMPAARNTMIVGEILLLIYHAMAIIVLVNMLIAMMSNSFQTIQNHADTEWKFARSKLWVGYFDEGSTLPPPLNTIVSPKSVLRLLCRSYKLIRRCFLACCHRDGPDSSQIKQKEPSAEWDHVVQPVSNTLKPPPPTPPPNWSHAVGPQRSLTDEETVEGVPSVAGSKKPATTTKTSRRPTFYQMVMCRLVRRYIHQSKKTMRQDGVNEDDLLEIKQDISSLRYELREDRKREVARTIGHLEGLKRDLLDELNKQFARNKQTMPLGPQTTVTFAPDLPTDMPTTHGQESPSPRIASPCLSSRSTAVSKTRPVKSFSVTQATEHPQTCSLTYGRETQHIYDEIKQLALMNTAYEGPYAGPVSETHLPIHIYTQLKFDIIRGVRAEIQQLLGEIPPQSGSVDEQKALPARKFTDSQNEPQRAQDKFHVPTDRARVHEMSRSTSTVTSGQLHPNLGPLVSPVFTDSSQVSVAKTHPPPRPLLRQARRSVSPADLELMMISETPSNSFESSTTGTVAAAAIPATISTDTLTSMRAGVTSASNVSQGSTEQARVRSAPREIKPTMRRFTEPKPFC